MTEDNDNLDRTEIIEYRLNNFVMNELGVGACTPTIDEFLALPGDTRFGFLPPFIHDGEVVVAFQPEMLSLLTDTLDDPDFIDFMVMLEWILAAHTALLVEIPDPDERAARVDSDLHDLNPKMLRFLSDVQFEMIGGVG